MQALHNTYALAGSAQWSHSNHPSKSSYENSFRKHKKESSKRQDFPNLTNQPANCMTPPCCSQLRSPFPYLTSSPALPPVARALATPAPAVIKGHQKITTGGHRSHDGSLCVSHHLGLRRLKMNPHLSESDPWLEGIG